MKGRSIDTKPLCFFRLFAHQTVIINQYVHIYKGTLVHPCFHSFIDFSITIAFVLVYNICLAVCA